MEHLLNKEARMQHLEDIVTAAFILSGRLGTLSASCYLTETVHQYTYTPGTIDSKGSWVPTTPVDKNTKDCYNNGY